jgi:hypothetical protein
MTYRLRSEEIGRAAERHQIILTYSSVKFSEGYVDTTSNIHHWQENCDVALSMSTAVMSAVIASDDIGVWSIGT